MRTVLEHFEQRKRRDVDHLASIDQRRIAGPLLQPATRGLSKPGSERGTTVTKSSIPTGWLTPVLVPATHKIGPECTAGWAYGMELAIELLGVGASQVCPLPHWQFR